MARTGPFDERTMNGWIAAGALSRLAWRADGTLAEALANMR